MKHRKKVADKIKEEEKEIMREKAKDSTGSQLQGLNQFDKQANEIEYMDFMNGVKQRANKKQGAASKNNKFKQSSLSKA